MAGLVPAIHAFCRSVKTWMPGTRPGMTTEFDETSRSYFFAAVSAASAASAPAALVASDMRAFLPRKPRR